MTAAEQVILDSGTLTFTVEGRLLRELGERLVKQPSVALVELIKNAYDADAAECAITYAPLESITVRDDGEGMTLDRFTSGWMRIGTSAKASTATSRMFGRRITGEKGIGRFAVRFLGRTLHLESVAEDPDRHCRTLLTADFDWHTFDKQEDLGTVRVPYALTEVPQRTKVGTKLIISALRAEAQDLDLHQVRTESIGVLSPLRSLFQQVAAKSSSSRSRKGRQDPGFTLKIQRNGDAPEEDVAAAVLEAYVLRAVLVLEDQRLSLKVYRRGDRSAYFSMSDAYENSLGPVRADVRFYPRRKGVFADTPIDGRRAYSWITQNSGVAVFDRDFRVQPYGTHFDDWLRLAADNARNVREPRSTMAAKHFPMSPQVRGDTAANWMLRLPQPAQLVGVIQVEGQRGGRNSDGNPSGLVASADREGYVANVAFAQLQDIIRGAVEAIALCDRRLQQEQDEAERAARAALIKQQTQSAIDEVEASASIGATDKARIISAIVQTQELVERQEDSSRERARQLEVMSLLGVVAGFMTHEFGTALHELREAEKTLRTLASDTPGFKTAADALAGHIKTLTDFTNYSTGYVAGSRAMPAEPFPVHPRIKQMIRIFGQYATERQIDIELTIEKDLLAPLVPVSLYNGVVLNLYTNALKAVTGRSGGGRRVIAFRAWNDSTSHFLEVSDTGTGIPVALRERVFDPLFTTTDSRNDPLGSGMGLGLALVQRGVTAFGGRVDLVDPPADFTTCVRVKLPLATDGS